MRVTDVFGALARRRRTVVNVARLVRSACGRWLWVLLVLQFAAAAVLAGELIGGRSVLSRLDAIKGGAEIPTALLALLAAIIAVGVLVNGIAPVVRDMCGNLVDTAIRGPLIEAAATMNLEDLENPEVHQRIHHVLNAENEVSLSLLHNVASLVREFATFIVASVFIAVLYPLMLVILPVAVVPMLVMARVDAGHFRRLWSEESALERERLAVTDIVRNRTIGGEIRIFAMSRPLVRREVALAERVRRVRVRYLQRQAIRSLGVGSVRALAVPGFLLLLLTELRNGRLSTADAVALAIAGQQAFTRMAGVRASIIGIDSELHTLEHFDDLVGLRQTPRPPATVTPDLLTVHGVSFTYPGEANQALRDVSFTARRGEVIAVVGGNGSGKTTLFALLADLRQPTLGAVMWSLDGQASPPPRVGAVFQPHGRLPFRIDQLLVPARVGELDPPNAAEFAARAEETAQLHAAVETVGLTDAVARLDDNILTRLGLEFGGSEFSAGQWQRLMIARALASGAPFLLLDEPGASLDPGAEAELFSMLRAQCTDRFVIVSSHRASSIMRADRVVVLHEGAVAEIGRPEELLNSGTALRSLLALDIATTATMATRATNEPARTTSVKTSATLEKHQ